MYLHCFVMFTTSSGLSHVSIAYCSITGKQTSHIALKTGSKELGIVFATVSVYIHVKYNYSMNAVISGGGGGGGDRTNFKNAVIILMKHFKL